jgi:chorismate mutase-like protein
VSACRRLSTLLASLTLAVAVSTVTPPALAQAAARAPVAASRLDAILARGVLRVGSPGDYKPFTYRSGPTGAFIGLDIALASDLAKSLGVRLQVVPTPWASLMRDLADDRFDVAIGGVSVSLQRQKKAWFSIPYLRDGKTLIARCEDAARYASLADIDRPEVRLIVNPGGTNERFARANAPHAKLTVHADNVTIFDRIVAGANEQWLAYPWSIESLRALIDARLVLASDVAQYKWNHQVPIEHLPRGAQVIASLGHQASDVGVPQPWAEGFFKAQIEASKIAQNELFHGWDVVHRGQFADAPDLATVTRPKLDRITELLLHALSENWPVLSDPKRRHHVLRALHPMQAEELSPRAVAEAIAPFGR